MDTEEVVLLFIITFIFFTNLRPREKVILGLLEVVTHVIIFVLLMVYTGVQTDGLKARLAVLALALMVSSVKIAYYIFKCVCVSRMIGIGEIFWARTNGIIIKENYVNFPQFTRCVHLAISEVGDGIEVRNDRVIVLTNKTIRPTFELYYHTKWYVVKIPVATLFNRVRVLEQPPPYTP